MQDNYHWYKHVSLKECERELDIDENDENALTFNF